MMIGTMIMMIGTMIMTIVTMIMMSANTFVRLRKLNTESSAVTYWLSRYLVKIGQMWRNYSVSYKRGVIIGLKSAINDIGPRYFLNYGPKLQKLNT